MQLFCGPTRGTLDKLVSGTEVGGMRTYLVVYSVVFVCVAAFATYTLMINQQQIHINQNQDAMNKALIARIEALESGSAKPSVGIPPLINSPEKTKEQFLKFEWRQNKNAPTYENEWELVGTDSRIYASISKSDFDSAWSVWHNGAGFGEFVSKDVAMREAENVANRLAVKTQ